MRGWVGERGVVSEDRATAAATSPSARSRVSGEVAAACAPDTMRNVGVPRTQVDEGVLARGPGTTRAADCSNSGRLSCDARMHYMRDPEGSFSNRPWCGHRRAAVDLSANRNCCPLLIIGTPRRRSRRDAAVTQCGPASGAAPTDLPARPPGDKSLGRSTGQLVRCRRSALLSSDQQRRSQVRCGLRAQTLNLEDGGSSPPLGAG